MASAFRLSASAALLIVTLGAQPRDPDGTILRREAYEPPPFEEADGIGPYASPDEYSAARNDRRFVFERIVYSSDGLPVVAYTYVPRASDGAVPTVVFNRGSYTRGEIGHQLLPLFHRLAEQGFATLAPMYRGSAGARGLDEMGGAEIHDLLATTALARGLKFVDLDNLFLYGESRGGMMTFLAIRHGYPARAAATFGGFTDLEQLMSAAPQRYAPLVRQIWPDFEARRAEILLSRSALRWPEALTIPLLLMHGGADRDVDPSQTLALAQALQRLGRRYELVIYDGDNHVLTAHRRERDAQAAAWFEAHLRR